MKASRYLNIMLSALVVVLFSGNISAQGNQLNASGQWIDTLVVSDGGQQTIGLLCEIKGRKSSAIVQLYHESTCETASTNEQLNYNPLTKTSCLSVSIANNGKYGLFVGDVLLINPNADTTHIPTRLLLLKSGPVVIESDGDELDFYARKRAPFSKKTYLKEGASVHNIGDAPITVSLIQTVLSPQKNEIHQVTSHEFDYNIPAQQYAQVGVPIHRKFHAGVYEGQVSLFYPKFYQPTTMMINVYIKDHWIWAILTILIGVFIGYMMRRVNENSDRIDLYYQAKYLFQLADNCPDNANLKTKINALINRIGIISNDDADQITEIKTELDKILNDILTCAGTTKTDIAAAAKKLSPEHIDMNKIKSTGGLGNILTGRVSIETVANVFRPIMVILVVFLSCALLFHQMYHLNDTFGQTLIMDYGALLITAAGIHIVTRNIVLPQFKPGGDKTDALNTINTKIANTVKDS